ncbi:MAG TPA: class I SAM-dependent methyltransferase [Rhizomicrobium sp.]|jgi:SAM-dependent methyltransferase|nr:class I SAM-dependent methyltransferase [Rhizomicrobium sp.]
MKLNPGELKVIADRTLRHYDDHAQQFLKATEDHDVSQNIQALLQHIEGSKPFTILDFGCGPGRDLKAFTELGHVAVGLDGSSKFAAMARDQGFEVWEQNFLQLDLPTEHFDGVFANATLFHIPGQELSRVLKELNAALKPRGVLFSSNPRGSNQEGWSDDRYGAFHDLEAWRRHMTGAGFTELAHYYRPAGLPRHEQPWLASVWRKA